MSLPPIDQALLPPQLRDAGGQGPIRDAYRAALGFERLLVGQLTSSVADSAQDALGGDSPYASLLPDALADAVMGGGGLGLAPQLANALEPEAAHSAAGHERRDAARLRQTAGLDAPRR